MSAIATPKSKKHKKSAAQTAVQLRTREALFVSALARGKSGTEAAKSAGYSEHTAGQIAHQLLKKLQIKKAVQRIKTDALEEAGLTREWVLRRMMRMADANLADYHLINDDGTPQIDLRGATREQMYALESIAFEEDAATPVDDDADPADGPVQTVPGKRKTKITLVDRKAILIKLGQEVGMFRQKLEVQGVPKMVISVVGNHPQEDDEFTPAEESGDE